MADKRSKAIQTYLTSAVQILIQYFNEIISALPHNIPLLKEVYFQKDIHNIFMLN